MANFNFNKVILGGRLTADPELKQTSNGIAVTSFSIAVNRQYSKNAEQRQTDFFNVVAWRQQAEFISRYFHKGSSICVVGALQTRSWTDPQGQKRTATEIVVDEAHFVDSKGEGPAAAGGYPSEGYQAPSFSSDAGAPKFEDMSGDDDLPF